MSGWQPIETAPKGPLLLLYVPDRTRDVGHWFEGGWWVIHALAAEPTHWMPLPEPPK